MPTPLSGTAVDLTHGPYTASIASVGASLRTMQHDGRDLIVPFGADEIRPVFRGATLAPWPNRVVDGKYTLDGVDYELALTEPKRHHALHGLACWLDFEVGTRTDASALLTATIPAQEGYPFRLDLEVLFELGDDGLTTTVTATNTGDSPAPYGTAPHPYLVAGPGLVDDWTLEVRADRVLAVTPDRLIPTYLADVDTEQDGALDFRAPRIIGDTFIDHTYTDIARDSSGTAEVRVTGPTGSGVAMRWGKECRWVQVFTCDQPLVEDSRLGLAVEPMTCPADAFNSGTDLMMIEPGESFSASWTLLAL